MNLPKPNARQAVVVEHLLSLPLDVRFEPGHVQHACKIAGYKDPKKQAARILDQPAVRAALIARNTVVQEIEASINDAWLLGELASLWETKLKELVHHDETNMEHLWSVSARNQKAGLRRNRSPKQENGLSRC